MRKTFWKHVMRSSITCLLLITMLLPTAVLARGRIEVQTPSSLTLQYPCVGAAFSIYKVADVSFRCDFTPTADFAAYPVSLTPKTKSEWKNLAETLVGYAARDGLEALASGTVNANGRLTFSQLETGLYLVVGQSKIIGGYHYTPEPLLISLPNRAVEEHQWNYDVLTSPKYSKVPEDSPGTIYVERKVLKVWEDGEGENRPQSIQVQLLKNGEVAETVTLSAENSWRYTWKKLDKGQDWRVVEKETAEGYTTMVSREGITFVITNTWNEPEQPDEPDVPGDIPDEPVPEGPKLPQTGQLWWPVSLLALAGMVLFLLGWIRKDKQSEG